MKKLTKVTALLGAVLMLGTLAACGGGDTGVSAPPADATPAPVTQAPADSAATYTVGICQLMQHEALDAATKGFQDALNDALPGQVAFDPQNASGDPNTCSTIINSFLSADVDLILANATPALQAAVSATTEIPILGTSVTEYGVALNLKDFSGTVGGNVSGTSDLAPLDQQAAMLQEFFPAPRKVGLIYCSAEANSQYQVEVVKAELEELGYSCDLFSFSDSNDLAAVVNSAVFSSDVIYVPTDNTVASNTGIIDNICRPAGIPVIAGEVGITKICGVATLSIDYYDLGVATGKMAAKILTGEANIAEMPIEYAPQFRKMYNAEICEELGITVPEGYEPIA